VPLPGAEHHENVDLIGGIGAERVGENGAEARSETRAEHDRPDRFPAQLGEIGPGGRDVDEWGAPRGPGEIGTLDARGVDDDVVGRGEPGQRREIAAEVDAGVAGSRATRRRHGGAVALQLAVDDRADGAARAEEKRPHRAFSRGWCGRRCRPTLDPVTDACFLS
jgi:hypothetical protein